MAAIEGDNGLNTWKAFGSDGADQDGTTDTVFVAAGSKVQELTLDTPIGSSADGSYRVTGIDTDGDLQVDTYVVESDTDGDGTFDESTTGTVSDGSGTVDYEVPTGWTDDGTYVAEEDGTLNLNIGGDTGSTNTVSVSLDGGKTWQEVTPDENGDVQIPGVTRGQEVQFRVSNADGSFDSGGAHSQFKVDEKTGLSVDDYAGGDGDFNDVVITARVNEAAPRADFDADPEAPAPAPAPDDSVPLEEQPDDTGDGSYFRDGWGGS